MGKPIIRADREHDLYVEWSSIVEAPTFIGTRAEMLRYLTPRSDPNEPGLNLGRRHTDPEARLRRADETGTSSLPDPEYDGPPFGSWDDKGFIVEQKGWLPRERLYAYLTADDPDNLLEPFEDDE